MFGAGRRSRPLTRNPDPEFGRESFFEMRYVHSAILGFLLLLFSFAPHVPSVPAYAVTVEPDVEVHRVVGALYALSAAMNLSQIETVFLFTAARTSFISSSIVRDVIRNHGDYMVLVPESVRV